MVLSRHSAWSSSAVLLLLSGGCAASSSSETVALPAASELPDARADAGEEELRERLAAAGRIAGALERDRAHAAVAYDAAASGRCDLCLEALSGMRQLFARDDAAASSALLALRQGDLAGARRVAEEVRQLFLRDAVMSAIASGAPAGTR